MLEWNSKSGYGLVSVGESDVGDGACPSVWDVVSDCPYCIIDGACANSPFLVDTLKVKDSDGMGWSRCE